MAITPFGSPAEALAALFSAFPADRGDGAGLAATYLMAIDGYPLASVDLAIRRLIRGEFDDVDRRFLPTPAQVSNAVAYCAKVLEPPPKRLALPAPGSEALTEEDLERRRRMAARAREMFGTQRGRSEPVPTPAEEFDAWEKREQERLRAEGLPKLSAHLVEDAKQKLADARRIAEALIAAEEGAEARRRQLDKSGSEFSKVTLSPTQSRTGKEAA